MSCAELIHRELSALGLLVEELRDALGRGDHAMWKDALVQARVLAGAHEEVEAEVLRPHHPQLSRLESEFGLRLASPAFSAADVLARLDTTAFPRSDEPLAELAAVVASRRSVLSTLVRDLDGSVDEARLVTRYVNVRRNVAEDARLVGLLPAILRDGDSCVDVGSHAGQFLSHIVRLSPSGRHVAFEPLPELAADLAAAHPEVSVQAVAASDRSARRRFHHVLEVPAYSGLSAREHSLRGWPDYVGPADVRTIEVPTERIDTVVRPDVDYRFVKVDVEGAELEVLRGAVELLERCRPLIAFEFMGSDEPDACEELWRLLVDGLGYSVYDLDGGGPFTAPGFELSSRHRLNTNYLARA